MRLIPPRTHRSCRTLAPQCLRGGVGERGRMWTARKRNHRCEHTKRPWYTPLLQIIVRKARIHALCAKPQTVSPRAPRHIKSKTVPVYRTVRSKLRNLARYAPSVCGGSFSVQERGRSTDTQGERGGRPIAFGSRALKWCRSMMAGHASPLWESILRATRLKRCSTTK